MSTIESFISWRKKLDKINEQLRQEREKRIMEVVSLGKPDRVPVAIPFAYFPAKFIEGVTTRDCWYDFRKWKDAYFKTALFYQPDYCGVFFNQSGNVMEEMDNKTMLWPGHGASINHSHQFIEGEYMKADEYDLFLDDYSDYLLRYHLPRTNGLLSPLSSLPPLNTLTGAGIPFRNLLNPDFVRMFEKLEKIAPEAMLWQTEIATMSREMDELGFPGGLAVGGLVPFDLISDRFRGMRGAMLDMYRQPDKLLAAIEKLSRMQVRGIESRPQAKEFTLAFIALHRGADGFMSLKQFETFYFPYLKRLTEALVARGFTPWVFFEGDYTTRLEYLLQLPRAKILGHFDRSDMSKVKAVLGRHMCIAGNVPPSILQTGTPESVKKYCKWLIDVGGKDGGYIMSPGSSVDEAKPENLKAMVDITKEYGRY
jgi:hypothetical protein